MSQENESRPILIVEDDPDDRFLIEKAFREKGILNPVQLLVDGEEMMDFLKRRGKFSEGKGSVSPCLILLDLNMPRMDGRKALLYLKSDPELKRIPVLVLSTSSAEEDITRSYNLGANSFIHKPVQFDGLLGLAESIKRYWLGLVELPNHGSFSR